MSTHSSASSSASSAWSVSLLVRLREISENLTMLFGDLNLNVKDLQYLAKGMNNIVYQFDLQSDPLSDEYHPYVIRLANVQRDDDEDEDAANALLERELATACSDTLDTALIMQSVSKHLPNTPTVFSFDATTQNAISRPYIIQSRLPGQPLDRVWAGLSLDAKLQIAEQVADFNLRCEGIELPICGELKALKTPSNDALQLGVRELHSSGPISFDSSEIKRRTLAGQCKRTLPTHYEDPDYKDMPEWLVQKNIEDLDSLSKLLTQVSKDPELKHFFSTNINDAHIKHCDLHHGNIMVHSGIDESGKETYFIGIIDWESAQALPKVLTRGAPAFLWQNDAEQPHDPSYWDWDGNVDFTPRSCREYLDQPHGREVKAHFDRYMMNKLTREQGVDAAEEWWEHTYGDATWVRRAAHLAFDGLDYASRDGAFKELVEDWTERVAAMSPSTRLLVEGPDSSAPTIAPVSPAPSVPDLSAPATAPVSTPGPTLPSIGAPTRTSLDMFAEIYTPRQDTLLTESPDKTPLQLEEGISDDEPIYEEAPFTFIEKIGKAAVDAVAMMWAWLNEELALD